MIGRINIRPSTSEELESVKNQYEQTPGVRLNRKSVSLPDASLIQAGGGGVLSIPVQSIFTDTARFQNRDAEFSAESVERIVNNFDPNKFDPVTVWRDPANGKTYVLSGHSRLTAFKRLGKLNIPAKVFQGTEAEAIRFARVDANRGATAETLAEDIKAYKLLRDGGGGVEKLTKKELAARFKDAAKLDLFTYLDPKGLFVRTMSDPKLKDEAPFIINRSMWVGELRKLWGNKLTNSHEAEIFRYFYITPPPGGVPVKDDFFALLQRKLGRFDYDPAEPLLLLGGETGTQARADTKEAEKRINELERENKKLREQYNKANTQAEKQTLATYIKQNLDEIERIKTNLSLVLKNQTALFGIGSHQNTRQKMTKIVALAGVENPYLIEGTDESETISGAAFPENFDPTVASEAETDLRLLKSEIQGIMEIYEDRYGATNANVQALADLADYVDDQIEAAGDEYRIDAQNADFEAGGYAVSAILGVMFSEAESETISGVRRATGLFQPLRAAQKMKEYRRKRKRRLAPEKRAKLRECMKQCRNASGTQWKGWSDQKTKGFAETFAKRQKIGDLEAVEVEAQNIAAAQNIADIRRSARALRKQRIAKLCACRHKAQTVHPETLRATMKSDVEPLPMNAAFKAHAKNTINALNIGAVLSGVFDDVTDPDEIADLIGVVEPDETEIGYNGSNDYETSGLGEIEEPEIGGKKKKRKKKKRGFFKRLGSKLKKAGRKIKKGLKKFGRGVAKVAKKVGKGILKAVTFLPRLMVKGLLELFDKAGGGAAFLYTYLTEAQAQKLGAKVVKKRRKQMGIRRFIIKAIGWKESRFNKMVRNGIRRKFKKSPEQWLKELMAKSAGKRIKGVGESGELILEPVTGIGALPLIPIIAKIGPALLKIIKKIAGLFKKKAPDTSDAFPSEGDFELQEVEQTANDMQEPEQYGGGSFDTSGGFSPTGGGGSSDNYGGGSSDNYGGGGSSERTTEDYGGSEDMPVAPNPTAQGGGGSMGGILPILLLGGAAFIFMNK